MMKAFHGAFDFYRSSNSIYLNSYQPSKTPIVKTSENLYQDVVNEKASAILTNSLPNSISRAAASADFGRRLDLSA
ncbi:MAG: hypothetical protein OIF32_03765 [Campylobacterales bacterium]|nr:hypothetical protein [Campylobacterales bacterium]